MPNANEANGPNTRKPSDAYAVNTKSLLRGIPRVCDVKKITRFQGDLTRMRRKVRARTLREVFRALASL